MGWKKARKDSIFTYLNVYQGAGPPSMKYTKSSYEQPIVVPHQLSKLTTAYNCRGS